jgi:hypothetical protein
MTKGFLLGAVARVRSTALSTAALALIIFCRPLCAQFITQPVSLAYLAQRADIIVQGRVAKVAYRSVPGYKNVPAVEVTLEVENMMRGLQRNSFAFREIFLGLRTNEGKRGYQVGQRLLLFLTSPSPYGLSSPVGIEQGRFHISYDSRSNEFIANELGNAGLFKNVTSSAAKAQVHLSSKQLSTMKTKQGPVLLSEFVSLVGTLTALPRIQ